MPEYPPIGGEITEEMMDQAMEKRNEAMSAMSEGICVLLISFFFLTVDKCVQTRTISDSEI